MYKVYFYILTINTLKNKLYEKLYYWVNVKKTGDFL